MIFALIPCLLFFLPACEQQVLAVQRHQALGGVVSLDQRCEELESEDSLLKVIQNLKWQMSALKDRLSAIREGELPPDISNEKEAISSSLIHLLRLSNSEFLALDYQQSLSWRIDESVFRELKPDSERWQIHNVKIESVFSWNSESEDPTHNSNQNLVDDFEIKFDPKILTISLNRKAHSIELCQLQNFLQAFVKLELINSKQRVRRKNLRLVTNGKSSKENL